MKDVRSKCNKASSWLAKETW